MTESPNPGKPANLPPGDSPERPDDSLAQAPHDFLADLLAALPPQPAAGPPASGISAAEPGLGPCPTPDAWLSLANGTPGHQDLLAHAAICPACAESLRQALRIPTANPSPDESTILAQIAITSPQALHRIAVELAHTPALAVRPGRLRWYIWTGSALAASLTLAVGLTVWWQHQHTPERLLAEAYTHSRTFDLRMPGAGFAPVSPESHLRGGASAHEASRLLDAHARIERHLETAPDNPHWLQLEARADLLEEKFDPAIDILDRLLAAGPVTAELLTDDAAAYFERGVATGSQNDRATALNNLSRADELAPGNSVVLFNEALVMEDRGQLMNAVETWERYLRFERDPYWLAEGRRRLELLKIKLDQLKTHQGRLDRYLASPQAMRVLAADPSALASFDEELSTSQLPRLLNAAFPAIAPSSTADRSRGSPPSPSNTAPIPESIQSARQLLHALADSLESNHQDPWLTQLLPPASTPPTPQFTAATQALAQAIAADVAGNYAQGRQAAFHAAQLFHRLVNPAGEDRAAVEQAYALQVLSDFPACYRAVHPLIDRNSQFAWIQIHALTENTACDSASGTSAENNPTFQRVVALAHNHAYTLLELRARNWLGAAAVDSGDVETSWQIYLGTVQRFWSGDYPAARLYSALSGLEEIEESTPRARHALLLQREALAALSLSQNQGLVPAERLHLAAVAIRAGAIQLAQSQMRQAQQELAAHDSSSIRGFLVEDENAMAALYLDRNDLSSASKILDTEITQLLAENNSYHRREYALNRGRLELALGHPQAAESLLRSALIEEERLAAKGGPESITLAQQDRDLYAVLAGVWLVQGRPAPDVLALWQRYRLRILGQRLPACPAQALDCLKPQLTLAISRLAEAKQQGQPASQVLLLGQIALFDRTLLYQVTPAGISWTSAPVGREQLLALIAPLEQAASSPATSPESVHSSATRLGNLLLANLPHSSHPAQLLIEPDPLLGNLPWPAVESAGQPIGLQFDLEETPSLLLPVHSAPASPSAAAPIVVGASLAPSPEPPLPEVLAEARAVAGFERKPSLLLGPSATRPQIVAQLAAAPAIHFAGHAIQSGGVTRLLLAPDSSATPWLDSDLLRKFPPRAAQLAVFSACSSGKKVEGWNHGMGDIVSTLAALGVPQVVATRWQIDSASAVPMMDAFYSALAQGRTVPAALTAARQSLARNPRYRHPYYWAAYYASGSSPTTATALFRPAR